MKSSAMNEPAADTIEFRWQPSRLRWFAVLVGFVALIAVPMLAEDDIGAKAVGVAWLAACAFAARALLRRGSDREPVVAVSAAGLRDRRIRDAVIPWAEIAGAEALEAEHVPFVGLEFHDPKAVLAAARPLVRWMAPLHRLIRFPSVSLSMGLLDGTDADLLAAIRRHAPRVVRREG